MRLIDLQLNNSGTYASRYAAVFQHCSAVIKLSGKNMGRPQLKYMLSYVRKCDTVIVFEISRFARNTKELLELIEISA